MYGAYRAILVLTAALAIAACEAPDPNANTPTSGRLIVYVDEMYAPLIETLRDTFALRSPNVRIEIHPMPARAAIEELLRAETRSSERSDTSATVAAIIGRRLLADEVQAMSSSDMPLSTHVIGHDGLVVAVARGSAMQSTTVEHLRIALKAPPGYPLDLDSTIGERTRLFLVPNQNSSTFMVVRSVLLGDSNIAAPVRYFASSDSVVERAAAGEGIALIGWYRAQRDSTRLRPLRIGHTDSLGRYIEPVRVHPATLVTGTYPLKQPIVGYALSPPNTLANGFLTWLARSQDAQYYLANHGMQPENVKITLVMPDAD